MAKMAIVLIYRLTKFTKFTWIKLAPGQLIDNFNGRGVPGTPSTSVFLAFFAGDDDGSFTGDAALFVAAGFDFLGEAATVFAAPLLQSSLPL